MTYGPHIFLSQLNRTTGHWHTVVDAQPYFLHPAWGKVRMGGSLAGVPIFYGLI